MRLGWDWRETFRKHNWQDEWPRGYKRQRRLLEPYLEKRGLSLEKILEICSKVSGPETPGYEGT